MTVISVDLDYIKPPTTARTTDANFLRGVIADVLDGWALQFGAANRDDALAAAADAARPDAGGVPGGIRRIRARQAQLIATGGFLTGATPRWLQSGSDMKARLAELSTMTAEEITAQPAIRALDGTNWSWNTLARVNAALRALIAQERAINQAAAAAIVAYRAAQDAEPPQPFNFDAIVWPAVYVPA